MYTIQQNIAQLVNLFGVYILFCFMETARPLNKSNEQQSMGNYQKEQLVSSCLENIISIQGMYNYFLTTIEYLLPANNLDKNTASPIKESKTIKKPRSALELSLERSRLIIKSLKKTTFEAHQKGKLWTELDDENIKIVSETLLKIYPNIYKELCQVVSDFKENPKHKTVSQRASWQRVFQ